MDSCDACRPTDPNTPNNNRIPDFQFGKPIIHFHDRFPALINNPQNSDAGTEMAAYAAIA